MRTITAIIVTLLLLITCASSDTWTSTPDNWFDAYVLTANSDYNTGDDPDLTTGNGVPEPEYIERVFIDWDLSGLELPEDYIITYAEAELYCCYLQSGSDGDLVIYDVAEAWKEVGEGGITWDNQPSVYLYTEMILSDFPVLDEWYIVDITEQVIRNYEDENERHGISFRVTGIAYTSFHSSEDTGYWPKLTIEYEYQDPTSDIKPDSLGNIKAIFR